jgi:hypothetical protein
VFSSGWLANIQDKKRIGADYFAKWKPTLKTFHYSIFKTESKLAIVGREKTYS